MGAGRRLRWVVWGGLVLVAAMIGGAGVLLSDSAPRVELHDVLPIVADDSGVETVPAVVKTEPHAEPRALDVRVTEGAITEWATFRGTVVTKEGGEPVRGAVVWHVPDEVTLAAMDVDVDALARFDGEVEGRLPVEQMTAAVTDANGAFEFRAPSLECSGASRWPDVPMLVITHPEVAMLPLRCAGFSGGDGAVYDVHEIGVERGAVVRGRLVADGPRAKQRPIKDGVVSVWSASWSDVWSRAVDISRWNWLDFRRDFFHFAEVRSRADGTFELPGVVAGYVIVEARAENRARWRGPGVYVDKGSELDLGDVMLQRGRIVRGFVVRDGSQQPVPDALVSLYDLGEVLDGEVSPSAPVVARGRTRPGGHVTIRGLPERQLAVVVEATGYRRALVGAVTTLPVGSDSVSTWTIHELPRVDVYASSWLSSLEDFEIDAWGVDRDRNDFIVGIEPLRVVAEERSTSFELIGAILRPRDFDAIVVRSKREGYVPTLSKVADVGSGIGVGASLKDVVGGRVIAADGSPVAGALVSAWPVKPWILHGVPRRGDDERPKPEHGPQPWDVTTTARTAPDGTFEMAAPSMDAFYLRASTGDGQTSERRRAEPDGKRQFTLRLEAAGVIEGQLIDPSRRALSGAEVTLRGPEQRKTRSDPDGHFRFGGVMAGTYRLTAEPGASADCYVASGETRSLELMARGKPVLRGQARRDVAAVPFARVTVWDESNLVTATADVTGFFDTELPGPGKYWIVARSAEGHVSGMTTVTVGWEQTLDVRVEFGTLTMRGRFGDEVEEGVVIAFARLERSGMIWREPVGADGRFAFEGLPREPVTVGISIDGRTIVDRSYEEPVAEVVFSTGTVTRRLLISIGPRWKGHEAIVDLENRVENSMTMVRSRDGATALNDPLSIGRLNPGVYEVTLRPAIEGDFDPETQTIEIRVDDRVRFMRFD